MSEQLHETEQTFHNIISENFDTETGLSKNTEYIQDKAQKEQEYHLSNPEDDYYLEGNNTSDGEIASDATEQYYNDTKRSILSVEERHGALDAAIETDYQVRENLATLRDRARALADQRLTQLEGEPTPPFDDPEDEWEDERRYGPGVAQVVNPGDGRIVPYGQMTPGDHPEGGRIVGYK